MHIANLASSPGSLGKAGRVQDVRVLSDRLFELLFRDLRGAAMDLPGSDAVLVAGARQ